MAEKDKRKYDSWHSYWTDTTPYRGSWDCVKKQSKEKCFTYIHWKSSEEKYKGYGSSELVQREETGINALMTQKWKESINKIFWTYTNGEKYMMKPDMKSNKIRR